MQGRLVIFEGIDHVGKSTLIAEVKNAYERANKTVYICQFPGKEDGTLGKLVYEIHHKRQNLKEIVPLSLQLLHIAAHIDQLERVILPILEKGCDILLDRYWWSTLTYGIASGVSQKKLQEIVGIEKEITDKIENKFFLYITRENREHDYENAVEQKILYEYEDLFSKSRDIKYKIKNDGEIKKTVEKILDILEIYK